MMWVIRKLMLSKREGKAELAAHIAQVAVLARVVFSAG